MFSSLFLKLFFFFFLIDIQLNPVKVDLQGCKEMVPGYDF